MNDMNWWKEGVFYHIYPRSFRDTNGDGIGDIPGIVEKLDYLQWLGIDAIWLSPIFPSPLADFGYDISDFRDIDPVFGSLADFDQLLEEAHARSIRVVIDQVYHNTSSEHEWFRESRSSRDNPRADWFIWKDAAAEGGPPNNWLSFFSGAEPQSAWEWCEERQQYYLHMFSVDQCDLNLRHPEVQKELMDVARFWLDRGVDGFRIDSVCVLFKDPRFPDLEVRSTEFAPSSFSALSKYFMDPVLERPENMLALEALRGTMNKYDHYPVAIGESASEKGLISYLDISSGGRLHMAFNFRFLNAYGTDPAPVRRVVAETEDLFDTRAWPCYVLGHHDGRRLLSRIGADDEAVRERHGKLAATLLLLLRGTPFIYYGEELGMTDTPIPKEKLLDPFGIAIWPEPGRDVSRTPMQWSGEDGAGFSTGEPWLPLNPNFLDINVLIEQNRSDSLLLYYRSLIRLRRAHPALREGRLELQETCEGILTFTRMSGDECITVYLNYRDEYVPLEVDSEAEILLRSSNTGAGICGAEALFRLKPLEAAVLRSVV